MTKAQHVGNRDVSELIPVIDVLTGKLVGRAVSLSTSMMQIACTADTPETLRNGALYQLSFALPAEIGGMQVECGVEVMSTREMPERHLRLIRVRFILIDPDVVARIDQWRLASHPQGA